MVFSEKNLSAVAAAATSAEAISPEERPDVFAALPKSAISFFCANECPQIATASSHGMPETKCFAAMRMQSDGSSDAIFEMIS